VPADLDRDLALEHVGPGRYVGLIRRNWWIDRGPNGGFLGALALNAVRQASGERTPCSLTVHFVTAAQEGPIDIRVETIREGRLLTNCLVRMEQDGSPIVIGLAALTSPRASTASFDDTAFPELPAPDALAPLPAGTPGLPPFLANYDVRLAPAGSEPGQRPEAKSAAWLRTATPRRPDALAVVAFADALPPSPWVRLQAPAPTPTIDLTVHLRDHAWYEGAVTDDIVLATCWSRLLANGLFEEQGELWSPSGVLLAQSRQLAFLLQ
jgi:acyl-CoA thioesterase